MERNRLLTTIDKLGSVLENTCNGLNVLKKILTTDEDSSPQSPVIPNAHEVETYLAEIENTHSQEAIALRTYQVVADSMSAYANFLQEQWATMGDDINKETLQQASVEYIANVFIDLHLVFDAIHATKWRSSGIETLISTFNFATWLMCDTGTLSTFYSVDFFEDASELWELLTNTVDDINIRRGKSPLSQRLGSFYAQLTLLNERMEDILLSSRSMWSKNRAIKKYVKGIKTISEKLSDLLLAEALFLKSSE